MSHLRQVLPQTSSSTCKKTGSKQAKKKLEAAPSYLALLPAQISDTQSSSQEMGA